MKILYNIPDGDYEALEFETQYRGERVSYLISLIERGEKIIDKESACEFDLRVIEVGHVDDKFLEFVRSTIQDYDDSKHQNFWLETEIIK